MCAAGHNDANERKPHEAVRAGCFKLTHKHAGQHGWCHDSFEALPTKDLAAPRPSQHITPETGG